MRKKTKLISNLDDGILNDTQIYTNVPNFCVCTNFEEFFFCNKQQVVGQIIFLYPLKHRNGVPTTKHIAHIHEYNDILGPLELVCRKSFSDYWIQHAIHTYYG